MMRTYYNNNAQVRRKKMNDNVMMNIFFLFFFLVAEEDGKTFGVGRYRFPSRRGLGLLLAALKKKLNITEEV